MKRSVFAGLVGLLTVASFLSAPPASSSDSSCQSLRLPVSLGSVQGQAVSAKLCTPTASASGPRQVDVLVHGGTYNSRYWDWPVKPELYSYVRKNVQSGRATFTYDLLGTGASTRPASAALTLDSDADVLHQLIQWLRGKNYSQVTVIGHSLGSMIGVHETAVYNDTNRLVITGVLHPPGLGAGAVGLFGNFYPAALDPRFMGKITDLGYLTTQPGSRKTSFYDASTADPAVIADDEANKDTLATTELADSGVELVPAYTSQVKVPVLVMVGQNDALLCNLLVDCSKKEDVLAVEKLAYTSTPSLEVETIPGTGHSLPLHPSANQSFSLIDQWIRRH